MQSVATQKYGTYTIKYNICTDAVEVVHNGNFTVIIIEAIDDIVLFHVHADVFLHLLVLLRFELERALQYINYV